MRPLFVVLLLLAVGCVADGEVDGILIPSEAGLPSGAPELTGTLARPEVTRANCQPVPDGDDETPDPEQTAGLRCGFVVLPEDRNVPTGPVVEVGFTRLEAVPPPEVNASPIALIVLADGPGEAMTSEVVQWMASSLRIDRDIILLDGRGAGRSFPSLDCGIPPRPGALPLDLVQDCRRGLQDQGIDLSAYTTGSMAADVVDVAGALDLDGFALLGIGHGARVALEVLRDAPDGLRAIVLDSPVPPEVDVYDRRAATAQTSFNQLFDECAESRGCARAFTDVRGHFEELVVMLDEAAEQAETSEGVTGDDLVRATFAAMRGARGPAAVPAAAAVATAGDPEAALAILQSAAVGGATVPTSPFSEGLLLSSECRDEVPFGESGVDTDGLEAIGLSVARDVMDLQAACEIWNLDAAPSEVTDPVEGEVPTLVLTGQFDPLSPAAWGAGVAARLSVAQVVQVDGAGHRVHDVDNCTIAIVAEFLRRPGRTVNDACARDRVVDFVLR